MLAGNVTAEIVDGDLIVTGDGFDNRIALFGPGYLSAVQGESNSQGPTSINGVPNGSFNLDALTGDVVVRIGDGNDTVFFGGAFPGAVVIEAGNGSDSINTQFGGDLAKELVVDAGPGSDFITVSGRGGGRESSILGLRIGTSAIITGGDDRDFIQVEQVYVTNDLVINAGAGADRIDLRRSSVGNFVGVDSGPGDDEIHASCNARTLSFQTGDGSLRMSLSCFASQDLGILATGGASIIGIGGSRVDGTTYIVGGQSNDYVKLDACRLDELQVTMGNGSDRLDVTGSILDRVFADLGADSDWLLMTYTAVNDQATLLGGLGFDVLSRNGNAFRRLLLGGFEG
jgi:hypothetical protein